MSPLLEQFLSEARDFLQDIGEKLMQLEDAPADVDLMSELFRFVHTLKGNGGLFDFPEMTRVLHAGEDLMDAVRSGHASAPASCQVTRVKQELEILPDDGPRGVGVTPVIFAEGGRGKPAP